MWRNLHAISHLINRYLHIFLFLLTFIKYGVWSLKYWFSQVNENFPELWGLIWLLTRIVCAYVCECVCAHVCAIARRHVLFILPVFFPFFIVHSPPPSLLIIRLTTHCLQERLLFYRSSLTCLCSYVCDYKSFEENKLLKYFRNMDTEKWCHLFQELTEILMMDQNCGLQKIKDRLWVGHKEK